MLPVSLIRLWCIYYYDHYHYYLFYYDYYLQLLLLLLLLYYIIMCIYIYMSHRKKPGNTKYVLDGHWFMEIDANC